MNYLLGGLAAVSIFFVLRTRAMHGFPAFAISALIIAVAAALWQERPETFEDRVARLTKVDAPHAQTGCSASRRAVEARLKAPASAKWGDCFSTTSQGVQMVQLTVDSQNGFGALIRSTWVATVRADNVESVMQLQ